MPYGLLGDFVGGFHLFFDFVRVPVIDFRLRRAFLWVFHVEAGVNVVLLPGPERVLCLILGREFVMQGFPDYMVTVASVYLGRIAGDVPILFQAVNVWRRTV